MITKTYYSKNGLYYFVFDFIVQGDHIKINCKERPSFNGHDPSVSKTHIYPSNDLCFVKGREPRSQWEAEMRAKQWSEYILEYRRTGKAQS